jgi:hypothetical protein
MSRGHAAIQVPVTLDAANRRKDRSVSIRFSSTLEMGTADFAELDRLTRVFGLKHGWAEFGRGVVRRRRGVFVAGNG